MMFSVVTICKNDIAGLRETAKSLSAQTHRGYEWVVVDGASTDGTVVWLRQRTWTHGTWISEPDRGIYSAMNKGIELGRGNYFLFMNSGDTFAANDVLSKVAAVVEHSSTEFALLYGDSIDVFPDGHEFYKPARCVFWIEKGMITHHQAIFFESFRTKHLKYRECYRFSGDYDFVARFLQNNEESVSKLEFPVCRFLLGGRHQAHRIAAVGEDLRIRRDVLNQGLLMRTWLAILHLCHFAIKRWFPQLHARVRYRT